MRSVPAGTGRASVEITHCPKISEAVAFAQVGWNTMLILLEHQCCPTGMGATFSRQHACCENDIAGDRFDSAQSGSDRISMLDLGGR